MAINIKRIGHVGFLVSDFDRSMHFYGEVAGLNPIHVADDNIRANVPQGLTFRFVVDQRSHPLARLAQRRDKLAAYIPR